MDPNELRSEPDDQAARGLTPEEQRAERDRESRETDETKFERARELEQDAREGLADELGSGR